MKDLLPPRAHSWLKNWRRREIDAVLGKADVDFPAVDAQQALGILEALDQPTSRKDALHWLTWLKTLTRERVLNDADLRAQLVAYAAELQAYPPDVVRDSCREWTQGNKWFPSWSELRAICESGVKTRRDLAAMLRERLQVASGRPKEDSHGVEDLLMGFRSQRSTSRRTGFNGA
jgi:hypothetical protein